MIRRRVGNSSTITSKVYASLRHFLIIRHRKDPTVRRLEYLLRQIHDIFFGAVLENFFDHNRIERFSCFRFP